MPLKTSAGVCGLTGRMARQKSHARLNHKINGMKPKGFLSLQEFDNLTFRSEESGVDFQP